jgi:hypothetical protein
MTLEDRIGLALEYSNGEYSVQDILNRIEDKLLIPLHIETLFVAVEVLSYPQKRILNIMLLQGTDFSANCQKVFDVICSLAKALDCSEVTWYGRPGWERLLRKHGVSKLYTVLRLEL